MLSFQPLWTYWSAPEVATNVLVVLHLIGALLLGLLVGYERSYRGRAAGMRTYGLVCMASAALVVITGFTNHWYGGDALISRSVDPTRIIQGIVTGIGFLGAGVIMKEGFNISGLTTSASIWATSAIGILVGVGFYVAAIVLAVLSAVCMIWVSKLEQRLPSRHAIAIVLQFKRDAMPSEATLRTRALERGYEIATGSMSILSVDGKPEWRFVAVSLSKNSGAPLPELARELAKSESIESFQLSHART